MPYVTQHATNDGQNTKYRNHPPLSLPCCMTVKRSFLCSRIESLTQYMLTGGSPSASQTRMAWRPFSTTFILGFCFITGNPRGTPAKDSSFASIASKIIHTEYSPSSAPPSSGKAPSSGQNPASQPFLFSKSPQQWTVPSSGQKILRFLSDFVVHIFVRICCSVAYMYTIPFK